MTKYKRPPVGTVMRSHRRWGSIRGHVVERGQIGWVSHEDVDWPKGSTPEPMSDEDFVVVWANGNRSRFGEGWQSNMEIVGGDDA